MASENYSLFWNNPFEKICGANGDPTVPVSRPSLRIPSQLGTQPRDSDDCDTPPYALCPPLSACPLSALSPPPSALRRRRAPPGS